MRRLLILPVLVLALAACGGDEAQQQRSEADQPCPEGTPSVSAAEVVGPTPTGYIVDRGDQQAIGEFASRISDSIGTTLRDSEEQLAVTGENITIGGAALVMLVDNRERRLRNAAAVVSNDG